MPTTSQDKPAKPTRAEKKAERSAKRQARGDQWRSIKQAFSMTRKNDSRLIAYMALTFLVTAGVVYALSVLITGHLFYFIPVAVIAGLLGAMLIFSRRAQSAAYSQADGQPGAALYVLQNLKGNDWKTTEAVAATAQLDAVHRLTGRPGIVLIAEGNPQRIKGLLAQEKKRLSRLVGDTPIYDISVGTGEGEMPLKKLNGHLVRLPRNLSREQVTALNRKLAALGAARMPIPQGPMPAGAKMRNVQRTMRRRSSS